MKCTIKQIFNDFEDKYLSIYKPNYEQKKIFNKITTCKTSEYGTRIYECEKCGHKIFAYNSYKDRHCPSCQNYKKEVWINKHKSEILDTTYFHIVLVVPKELRFIFYYNKKIYDLLFKSSIKSLQMPNIEIGVTSMLHTWSQKANYHPHIHMIVTGGGIKNNKWVNVNSFNTNKIANNFKNNLLNMISKEELNFYGEYEYLNDKEKLLTFLEPFYNIKWICYCKKTFNDAGQIYEYLGNYAFKVCMTDEKIVKITRTHVYFKYRDRESNQEKVTKIKGEEFIRKYLMHVLPHSFMKIRHYGLFAGKGRQKRIKKLQVMTKTKKKIRNVS